MYVAKCNNGKVEMYPCHGVNAFYYSVHWNKGNSLFKNEIDDIYYILDKYKSQTL